MSYLNATASSHAFLSLMEFAETAGKYTVHQCLLVEGNSFALAEFCSVVTRGLLDLRYQEYKEQMSDKEICELLYCGFKAPLVLSVSFVRSGVVLPGAGEMIHGFMNTENADEKPEMYLQILDALIQEAKPITGSPIGPAWIANIQASIGVPAPKPAPHELELQQLQAQLVSCLTPLVSCIQQMQEYVGITPQPVHTGYRLNPTPSPYYNNSDLGLVSLQPGCYYLAEEKLANGATVDWVVKCHAFSSNQINRRSGKLILQPSLLKIAVVWSKDLSLKLSAAAYASLIMNDGLCNVELGQNLIREYTTESQAPGKVVGELTFPISNYPTQWPNSFR